MNRQMAERSPESQNHLRHESRVLEENFST